MGRLLALQVHRVGKSFFVKPTHFLDSSSRLCLKDIHLGLKTLAQAQIIRADLKPAPWLLIEVETSTNFDHPAVIEPDFTVVHVGVELHFQLDVEFQETLL